MTVFFYFSKYSVSKGPTEEGWGIESAYILGSYKSAAFSLVTGRSCRDPFLHCHQPALDIV